jgi:hypothetical protein
MATFGSTRRILVAHNWRDLAEWVQAIEKLADMTDDEIDRIAGTAPDNLADAA